MAELADAADLKSADGKPSWEFEPPSRHVNPTSSSPSRFNKRTVLAGGGGGKLWRIGEVSSSVNTRAMAFYNAITPAGGPNRQVRFQIQQDEAGRPSPGAPGPAVRP